ncbi:unnamed protein product [Enterobius vermicularis]|uniref:Aminopeptidase n=1 Tax=Enterobius vermicularis TaxID=51028 RepID=A0A158QAY4_ENTVE|nr:unnamed protein product [Enterobius vermicularis]
MEEVDLDRSGLMGAAVEPAGHTANSVTPANSLKTVEGKKNSDRISCSKISALLLFLIVVAAIILTAFVTYWITKGIYDHSSEFHPFTADELYETTTVSQKEQYIDEGDGDQPTAAELRLPRTLFPIWYNVTFKTYLPGYVDIEAEKNLTFEAAMIMKFRAEETTDKIVLNSLKLTFPQPSKIKITKDIRKDAQDEGHETEISGNISRRGIPLHKRNEEEVTTSASVLAEESEKKHPKLDTEKGQKSEEGRTAAHAQVKSVIVNETVEMVTLELTDTLKKGETYYIVIYYSGPIDKKLAGLYLSRYYDENGKERLLAATQMEPTDARRMVPCFDEPDFKAVWKIRVIHPKGTRAISNGLEIKNAVPTDKPDWVLTSFQESLPMSSYLVAVLVSDFEYKEGKSSRGTRFRIWARREAINQTGYALDSGIKAMEFYENYYGIPFPLQKQDLVALPDFAAGAMENWGLITYRERALLYDEKLYTPYNKVRVALVIAHELSHQWFGNLVTMKWWNDLWLNEGFATFMEYKGADAISKGDFRMNEYFLLDAVENAMHRDARASSHPLIFNIAKAEDVSEAFDDISYDKGASIINMVQNVMGQENFRKGLNVYLESHKYGNAVHKDLWKSLNEAVPDTISGWDGNKLDIDDFASKWTEQMGYPVVEMRRIDEDKIELHQRRFKWDDNSLEKEKYRNAKYWYKYDIPIWYNIDGEEKPMTWLHEAVSLNVKREQLLVINSESRGFYRVNYNKECWEKIIEQLLKNHTAIDSRSRARIVDDSFALAEAGHLPYQVALNVTQYLKKETELLPWALALTSFSTILVNFGDEPQVRHVRDTQSCNLHFYKKEERCSMLSVLLMNSKLFSELEIGLIRRLCNIRNLNCTERLQKLFQTDLVEACQNTTALASECSRVPVPVRSLAYCEGVKVGAERTYSLMLKLYMKERVQVEKERILAALTCSRDPYTLKTLMEFASNLNDTTVRLQDAPSVFSNVAVGTVGDKIIFDYFQDNWLRLYNDMKDQQTLLRRIISASLDLRNERKIAELEAFIKKHKSHAKKLDIFNIKLEASRTNKLWMDRNFNALTEWFKRHNELRESSESSQS